MLPHEILDLTLEDLKNGDEKERDNLINNAFNEKMRELITHREEAENARNKRRYDETVDQEKQVRAAHEQLYTEAKRNQYLANQNNRTGTAKDTKLSVSEGDLSKIEQAYNQFVDTNYATHPDKKTKFVAERRKFDSYQEFKESNLYNPETDSHYNKDNFPGKVLVLTFDSWKDALKFVKENKAIFGEEEAKKLETKLEELISKKEANTASEAKTKENTSTEEPISRPRSHSFN